MGTKLRLIGSLGKAVLAGCLQIIDTNNALAVEEGRLNDVISEKKEIEQRMYLNGHRSADSATVYNLRHTKEQAEKLLKNEQNRIDEHLRIGEV